MGVSWPVDQLVRFIVVNVLKIYKVVKPVITKKFAMVKCFNV